MKPQTGTATNSTTDSIDLLKEMRLDKNTILPGFTSCDERPARLPLRETPAYRVQADSAACNLAELLSVLIGGAAAAQTATRLIEHFGSAFAIAQATPLDLKAVKGVGPRAAANLRAAIELARRAQVDEDLPIIRSPADAAGLLIPRMAHLEQEYLYVVLLNTRNRVIGEPIEVYHGSLNTSLIRLGEVFRDAIKANAAAIIVAHCHPSGDPTPSPEDVAVSRALVEAGKLLDVQVTDHLVIGHQRFVSMRERGLGFDSRCREGDAAS